MVKIGVAINHKKGRCNIKYLRSESQAFDRQINDRIAHGFIPDLRRLRKVPWFCNNPWREPEFAKIVWFPTLETIIGQAQLNGELSIIVGSGHGMLYLDAVSRVISHIDGSQ